MKSKITLGLMIIRVENIKAKESDKELKPSIEALN